MNAQRPARLDWPFDVLKLAVTLVALVGVLVALGGGPTPGQTAGPGPTGTPGVGSVPAATNTPANLAQQPTATAAAPGTGPTVEATAISEATAAPTAEPTAAPTQAAAEATDIPAATEPTAAAPDATAEPTLAAIDVTDTPAAPAETPVPPADTPATEPTPTPDDPFALRIVIPSPGRSLSSAAQVFTGTGPAKEVVVLLDEAERVLGKATVRDDGSWRIIIEQSALLPAGEHTVRAGVIDKAGTVIMSSEPVIVTVAAS